MKNVISKVIFVSLIVVSLTSRATANVFQDFDGDGKTDFAVRRIVDGLMYWYISGSSGKTIQMQWGVDRGNAAPNLISDFPACEDYDGDGKWDIAVFRVNYLTDTQTYFYIYYSATNTFQVVPWGLRNDGPVSQDFDGDGIADIAVTRDDRDGIIWFILQSRDGLRIERWGKTEDVPVRGDYDGDGKADLAIYRRDLQSPRADYTFYIKNSSDGSWKVEKFGYAQGDIVVAGDFDGDGKNDIAVFRGVGEYGNGVWYWHRSSDGLYEQVQWGGQFDHPVQGDYDGDGKTDPAVWRNRSQFPPEQQYFMILQSRDGIRYEPWGLSTDGPVQGF